MGMQIKQPEWEKVEYSRKRIERAGKEMISGSISDEEKKKAVAVIDNWRAAHAYPLHYIYMNLKKYAVDDKNIIVAQRLKRLDSIVDKLKRYNTMNLWKMQDLGGCRVSSFARLREAYPNYFADIGEFVGVVKGYLK